METELRKCNAISVYKIFLVLRPILTHDHSVNFVFIACTVISKAWFVNLK
jgi:hypothetical protein